MVLINSLSSSNSSFTDLTPPLGLLYYQIEVVKNSACNPSKLGYQSSRSNISNTGLGTGLTDQQSESFVLYPNPTSGIFNIEGLEGIASVYDVYGRLILRTKTTFLTFQVSAQASIL